MRLFSDPPTKFRRKPIVQAVSWNPPCSLVKTFGAKTRRSDQDILHSGPNRLLEQDQVLNMGVGLPACTTDGAKRIIYDIAGRRIGNVMPPSRGRWPDVFGILRAGCREVTPQGEKRYERSQANSQAQDRARHD